MYVCACVCLCMLQPEEGFRYPLSSWSYRWEVNVGRTKLESSERTVRPTLTNNWYLMTVKPLAFRHFIIYDTYMFSFITKVIFPVFRERKSYNRCQVNVWFEQKIRVTPKTSPEPDEARSYPFSHMCMKSLHSNTFTVSISTFYMVTGGLCHIIHDFPHNWREPLLFLTIFGKTLTHRMF